MKALFDTTVLVDFAQQSEKAARELERYDHLLVSRITYIEFLVGARTYNEESKRRLLLDDVEILELDPAVAEEAILIRKKERLKLPDAVIWATARVHGLLLITLNHRDFPRWEPDIRIPY